MRNKSLLLRFLSIAGKLVVLTIVIMPFYIAVVYSLKSRQEISVSGLAFPHTLDLNNFIAAVNETIISGMSFWRVIQNTAIVTVVSTVILTALSSMAAYAIARRKGKVYTVFYSLLVLTLLIPIQAYMFPLYSMLRGVKLADTLTGFILAKIGSQIGYSVIIVTGFVKTIPVEMDEAALVDGSSTCRTLFTIIVPLMRPIILTSVIINALNVWNDFSLGFIILTKPINYIVSLLQFSFIGTNSSQLNLAFALFSISMLPLLIVYFILQEYIISGITLGSVKG